MDVTPYIFVQPTMQNVLKLAGDDKGKKKKRLR